METPDGVVGELRRLQGELEKAPQALFDAETKLAGLEADLDKAEAHAILGASGTALEKQATARLAVSDVRFARDVARAELNRVKMKIRVLESAGVSTAVIAKQIELMYR